MGHHVQNMQNVYGNTTLLGYVAITGSMVRAQIEALRAGRFVNTPMEAIPRGEQNRVRVGATTTGQAALKVAYWIAVLGRVNRNKALIANAEWFLRQGSGSDRSESAIRAMFAQGRHALKNQTGRWAAYVRASLGSQETQTQSAQRIEEEQGNLLTRIVASSDTIGEKLPSAKKAKWAGRAVIAGILGTAALITYFVYVKPAVKRGRAAYDRYRSKS
jgi:hypothetical protein